MEKEGKYIYCIIGTKQERNFGPIGVGGRGDEVLTVGYDDLCMVVSNHPMTRFTVDRENMLAHEKVIEKVMTEFDSVLPVRFGTVASSTDEIRNLLDRRYREFRNSLKYMDHKLELGVKGIWKDMGVIFREIREENKDIELLKEKMRNDSGNSAENELSVSLQAKVKVGKMVQQALVKKKKEEAERLIDELRRSACDYKCNATGSDDMFVNAVFLIDKGHEKEFDNIMDDLSEKYNERIHFIYSGPLPVFNFTNIAIYPEAWEK